MRPVLLALLGATVVCQADIKVGSYSWSQIWQSGAIKDIPAANQYGGGYTHLDVSWTWTMEASYGMINADWTQAADCLNDNPTWYAGHGCSLGLADYIVKTKYPALWTRLKTDSDAGRYDGGAMSWQEGYWAFGGDEYYLRNYYISTRFCKDNFGYLPQIAACYDVDAAGWTQPKLQSYMVGRSAENPTGLSFYNHTSDMGSIWVPPGYNWSTLESYKWTSDDGSTVIVGFGGGFPGDGGGTETCVNSAGTSRTFVSKVLPLPSHRIS